MGGAQRPRQEPRGPQSHHAADARQPALLSHQMKILFRNARIIDGKGDTWTGWVALEGRKIHKVGRGAPPPLEGYDGEDLHGMALMPGFIDCHVHLRSDGDANPRAQQLSDTD